MERINADIIIDGNRENIGFGEAFEGLSAAGYTMGGEIEPTSERKETDRQLFYIAKTAGTYENYGGITVDDGEIAFIYKDDGEWVKVSAAFATTEQGATADKSIQFDKSQTLTNEQRITALANVSNQTADVSTGKMGYKVLQPESKATFQSQVTETNTIYEIRNVFDLDDTTFATPANCTLKFNGGVIKNCKLVLDNTYLEGEEGLDPSVTLEGTCANTVLYSSIYRLDKTGATECSDAIQSLVNVKPQKLVFKNGTYKIQGISVSEPIVIDGGLSVFKGVAVVENKPMCKNFINCVPNEKIESIVLKNTVFDGELGNYTESDIQHNDNNDSAVKISNVENVSIENCTFKHLYSWVRFDSDAEFYEFPGIVMTVKDCDNVVVDSCEFYDNTGYEWVFISPLEGSYLTDNSSIDNSSIIVRNCHIHNPSDDCERKNTPINAVATRIRYEHNLVENYKYRGSCFNAFGLDIVFCDNAIKNCWFKSALDTCEWGLFRNDNVEVYNNDISIYNGCGCVINTKNASIHDNVFNCMNGINLYGAHSITPPSRTCDDFCTAAFGVGENISIKHNVINANYIDMTWTYDDNSTTKLVDSGVMCGINVMSFKEVAKKLDIVGNSIEVSPVASEAGVDSSNVTEYKRQPVMVRNFKSVEILGNNCKNDSRCYSLSTFTGFTYIVNSMDFAMDSLVVANNVIKGRNITSGTIRNYIVSAIVSSTSIKYIKLNTVTVQGNTYLEETNNTVGYGSINYMIRDHVVSKLYTDNIDTNDEILAIDIYSKAPIELGASATPAVSVITPHFGTYYRRNGIYVTPGTFAYSNRCEEKYNTSMVSGATLNTGDIFRISNAQVIVNIEHGASITVSSSSDIPDTTGRDNGDILTFKDHKWVFFKRAPMRYFGVIANEYTSLPTLTNLFRCICFSTTTPNTFQVWNGSNWQNMKLPSLRGTTANRPTGTAASGILNANDIGIEYFDTDTNTPVYASAINSSGVVTWTRHDGWKASKIKGNTAAMTGMGLIGSDEGYLFYNTDIKLWCQLYIDRSSSSPIVCWQVLGSGRGSTDQRPSVLTNKIGVGMTYYDTDLNKMIMWSGTAWVNMDGSALS